MPIYEYRCNECGHEEEVLQKVSEPALTVCPACRKPALRKLLSAAGFQLKGSGWYATDFKGKPAPQKTEAKGDAKPEAKSETKSETKSDAKNASTPATTD